MNNVDATLYIDVWGTFFRQILSPNWFSQVESNCGCKFKKKIVCVNNIDVRYKDEFKSLLNQRLFYQEVDGFIDVNATCDAALAVFDLSREAFKPLEYQSTADVTALSRCSTRYIVFFSGDSAPWGSSNWVREGIDILEKDENIMVVNPVWNGLLEHARCWSNPDIETEAYFLGHGFSDQCYLARTDDLKHGSIYHETNSAADALYCKGHGNQFEKRVDAWMRNHKKLRATIKNAAYITRP